MRSAAKLRFLDPHADLFSVRTQKNSIQWPTEQEIRGVSQRLARIQRVGIRCEADGDYFKSGDLAYQIQEIIQTTAGLLKKSQRVKGQPV